MNLVLNPAGEAAAVGIVFPKDLPTLKLSVAHDNRKPLSGGKSAFGVVFLLLLLLLLCVLDRDSV